MKAAQRRMVVAILKRAAQRSTEAAIDHRERAVKFPQCARWATQEDARATACWAAIEDIENAKKTGR